MAPDGRGVLRRWFEAGLSFIYPEVCQICGKNRAIPEEGYVCGECQKSIRFVVPPFCERCGLPFQGEITTRFVCSFCRETKLYFSYSRSAVGTNGIMMELIHRFKYQHALWFEPLLSRILLEAAAPVLKEEAWDVIIPVPLHRLKQSEREFNQAESLARPLSKAIEVPVDVRLLARVLPTPTQTQLTRAEREANMRGAFAVRDRPGVANKRIIVVDDVRTTGATTNACAKALIEGGASEVCVWTLSRTLLK